MKLSKKKAVSYKDVDPNDYYYDYSTHSYQPKRKKRGKGLFFALFLILIALFIILYVVLSVNDGYDLSEIPEYAGDPYVVINNNQPTFDEKDLSLSKSFEIYSALDSLGRCGAAYANISRELMPMEERESIGMIKPSGWQTVKYPDLIEDQYLYNRCHLIGYQLSGENANEKNLITGTRYLNIEGMLPFEMMVVDYVEETGNHVLYRVTPVFKGTDLVARGVVMEAYSIEDNGEGIYFCVYCYNVQPGIEIDYATGNSRALPN